MFRVQIHGIYPNRGFSFLKLKIEEIFRVFVPECFAECSLPENNIFQHLVVISLPIYIQLLFQPAILMN